MSFQTKTEVLDALGRAGSVEDIIGILETANTNEINLG